MEHKRKIYNTMVHRYKVHETVVPALWSAYKGNNFVTVFFTSAETFCCGITQSKQQPQQLWKIAYVGGFGTIVLPKSLTLALEHIIEVFAVFITK